MNTLRHRLFLTVCVVAGFTAGWQLHRPSATGLVNATEGTSTATKLQPQPTATGRPPTTRGETGNASPSIAERLEILRWLKSNRFGVSDMNPFNHFGQLNPKFALVYGLTPAESAQLTQAYEQARQRLADLSAEHALLDPASTNEKLIVTLPAFPAEGGEIYNDYIAKFSSVLGAERYAQYNEISGDSSDYGQNGFGLLRKRYEVSYRDTANPGLPRYEIKEITLFPDGRSSEGNHSLFADYAVIEFPALRSYRFPSPPAAASK